MNGITREHLLDALAEHVRDLEQQFWDAHNEQCAQHGMGWDCTHRDTCDCPCTCPPEPVNPQETFALWLVRGFPNVATAMLAADNLNPPKRKPAV